MSEDEEHPDPDELDDEELEEELTIAATGDEKDLERDERFQELLDEHERRDPEE